LFFNFFELFFHAYYQLLNVGIVGFGAQGIYFAAYLLRDKAQFFAIGIGIFQGFDKIITMCFQAYFFFGNIQLINVIDQLLLKAVLINSFPVRQLRLKKYSGAHGLQGYAFWIFNSTSSRFLG
jgi:hypothetical protein